MGDGGFKSKPLYSQGFLRLRDFYLGIGGYDKTKLIPIRRILDLQRIALEREKDLNQFSWLDSGFHEALCAATGNITLPNYHYR